MAIGSPQWMYSSGVVDNTDYDDDYYSYKINNSVRLEDTDSANFSRTFSSGNRQTWSYSLWYKPSTTGGTQRLIRTTGAGGFGVESTAMLYGNGTIDFLFDYNGGNRYRLITASKHRDPSKWYHFLFVADTTNGNSNNRMRIYVNNERETVFTTKNMPSQNYSGMINYPASHGIGDSTGYIDGQIAEVHFIDGTALPTEVFIEAGDYGDWKPKAYNTSNGGYGTNGFYLKFANSSNLGTDSSGEGHNWTANNLSATDQLIDSPTNNFPTLNPLGWQWSERSATMTQANLKCFTGGADWTHAMGTQLIPKDKKAYFEIYAINDATYVGVALANENTDAYSAGSRPDGGWIKGLVSLYTDTNTAAYVYRTTTAGSALGTQTFNGSGFSNAVIGVAVDQANQTVDFYINGSLLNSSDLGITSCLNTTSDYVPIVAGQSSVQCVVNFGQDSSFAGNKTAQGKTDYRGHGDFYYDPPTGYLAMCANNIPKPAIIPTDYFNTVLWSGNGSNRNITVGFQPDLVWGKNRNWIINHFVFDSVRGATKQIETNTTTAQTNQATMVTAFNSDSFSLGTDSAGNGSGYTYAAWNWKAGGSSSSNTNGDITSTVSANQDAGFSIVKWTHDGGSNPRTIGHGLSKAPQFMLLKHTNSTSNWYVMHQVLESTQEMELNNTSAVQTGSDFGSVAPTSSVFSTSTTGVSGRELIAYCWHEVEGHSKFGTYIGNAGTNGSFINCGFRPACIIVRQTNAADDWGIYDSKRVNGFNEDGSNGNGLLYPNLNIDEEAQASRALDILSNGFKLRTGNATFNENGAPYIFMAWAETPFKYSLAR